VQQVFTNLIIHAIEAMPGGGELKVTSHQLTVNSKIQIEIVDTGEGIPLDKIDKIFDPFFTLKEKGTGLGLFMAIRTMQEHGGTIEVKSPIHPLGKGACFAVKLPILP
jgi:signal transduction histidine kinase